MLALTKELSSDMIDEVVVYVRILATWRVSVSVHLAVFSQTWWGLVQGVETYKAVLPSLEHLGVVEHVGVMEALEVVPQYKSMLDSAVWDQVLYHNLARKLIEVQEVVRRTRSSKVVFLTTRGETVLLVLWSDRKVSFFDSHGSSTDPNRWVSSTVSAAVSCTS